MCTQNAAKSRHDAPAARLLFAHCETLVPLATLMGVWRADLPGGEGLEEAAEAALAGVEGG